MRFLETEEDGLVASDGSIEGESHSHLRLLDTTLRTGTTKFDNYRRVGNDRPRFTSATPLALDNNETALRQTVWMATDRVYRGASQRLIQLKANDKLRAAAEDTSDDFSVEKPEVAYLPVPTIKFNTAEWTARLKKLSAEFKQYPGALAAHVSVESERVSKTLVSSEGTRVEHGRTFARIVITARGKASDGMDLQTLETFESDDPAKLPKDEEILAAVKKVGANLQALLHAPLADPFVGPAIPLRPRVGRVLS